MAWPNRTDTCNSDVLMDMHRPVESQPSDPTAITGTTAKMLGLKVAFTPVRTGRIAVFVKGNITCDTTAKTTTVQLKYGTGAAPDNDDANAGTQAGVDSTFTALTGMLTVPWSDVALVPNLTLGTAYWIDYNAKTDDANAAGGLTGLNFVVMEI